MPYYSSVYGGDQCPPEKNSLRRVSKLEVDGLLAIWLSLLGGAFGGE